MKIRKRSNSSPLLKKRSRDRKLQVIFSKPVLAGAIAVIIIFSGIYLSGIVSEIYLKTTQSTADTVKKIGFHIKTINIIGRTKTPFTVLQKAMMFQKGDHIFNQDMNLAKDRIEQTDWVKSAIITRTFPDTLTVIIEERTPIALWKQHKKYFLVDAEGAIIKSNQLEQYAHLPLVSGDGAAQHIDKTLEVLKQFPEFKKKIKSMIRIRNRRWDMILFKSLIVKLPEDIGTVDSLHVSFTQLEMLIKKNKLTPESQGYVDLRIPEKITAPKDLNSKAK